MLKLLVSLDEDDPVNETELDIVRLGAKMKVEVLVSSSCRGSRVDEVVGLHR